MDKTGWPVYLFAIVLWCVWVCIPLSPQPPSVPEVSVWVEEELAIIGMSLDLLQAVWGEPYYCSYSGGNKMGCIWFDPLRSVLFEIDGSEWCAYFASQWVEGEHGSLSP